MVAGHTDWMEFVQVVNRAYLTDNMKECIGQPLADGGISIITSYLTVYAKCPIHNSVKIWQCVGLMVLMVWVTRIRLDFTFKLAK